MTVKIIVLPIRHSGTSMVAADDQSRQVSHRLWFIDAFRGLVMASMMVSSSFAPAVAALPQGWLREFLTTQLNHATWDGFTRADFTFAGFVMLVGLSITLSVSNPSRRQIPRTKLYLQILRRGAVLFLIGFLLNGGFSARWPDIRLAGVLQRLAICDVICALIYLHCGWKVRLGFVISILLGYWGLLALAPCDGPGETHYSFEHNLAASVDSVLLPGRKFYGTWDPEGILSTLPAVASCLIGTLWGDLILKSRVSWRQKARWLMVGGCLAINVGMIWDLVCPINKSLWTSSYVVLTTGIGSLLLGACLQFAEVWNARRLTFPLVVVGRNLLVAYLVVVLVPLNSLSARVVGGDVGTLLGAAAPLVAAAVEVSAVWLLLFWLYRNRLVIRV